MNCSMSGLGRVTTNQGGAAGERTAVFLYEPDDQHSSVMLFLNDAELAMLISHLCDAQAARTEQRRDAVGSV